MLERSLPCKELEGEHILGGGDSACKGPEAGRRLGQLRNRKEVGEKR